ncbi:MAG: hypothetical protein O2909_01955 [Chloroflexi bacterium]|nr:hypothetical protein [Chloroflexota bacterium]MDA1218192.1 hypothetical protein [Chloroflexota bacterium]PKB57538.1 MAG: hypothetical protein BZY73_02750 [SAR202 cluster bacterium Casp-Chloro-G3]
MAWRDTIESLQIELADVRAERTRQSKLLEAARQSQREQLSQMAESLGIAKLIDDMNSVLLRGIGEVESYSSWDPPEKETEDDLPLLDLGAGVADDDDADYVSTVLTWDEDGECEIAVDLGFSEDGIYLQINEIDVRPEREALEQALVEAFREELQV